MRYGIEKIGIHTLAFLTARCSLCGMYPFAVPFFMGAYLCDRSSAGLFAAVILGVASRGDFVAAFQYALVLAFLLGLLKSTDRSRIFTDRYQIAIASGAVLWAIGMPYEYLASGRELCVLYTLLEGMISGCAVPVMEQGLTALRAGTGRMFADNKRFIGVFTLMAVALFGCPRVEQPFSLLFVLSGYLVLYATYRFEPGVAIATGSVTGLVLAFGQETVSFLAVMILLSGILILVRELGKPGMLLAFFAGYLLLGTLYERALLESSMLISSWLVLVAFLLTPQIWLKRVRTRREDLTQLSQDILIQEASREQIRQFGQAFSAMGEMLSMHEENRMTDLPGGLSNMYLSGDGISLLNAVESQSNRLIDLRRNFVRQLTQVGEVIQAFPVTIAERSMQTELFEGRVAGRCLRLGVVVTKAVQVKDAAGRTKVYLSCYLDRECVVTGRRIAEALGTLTGKRMVCVNRGEDAVGRRETNFQFAEEASYMLTTGIVRRSRSKETCCGDNFSVSRLDNGKAVLMIADGMGSGEDAFVKSSQVVDLLERLLAAGFERELAIEMLNSFISFLDDGGNSSTLDLTMVDLYTGMANFVKLGASTTFIRRKDRVECIRSTSLPVGVLEQIEFDTCERKLYHGDVVVMVSDGVLDGILFENKETYLADRIAGLHTHNAQRMAELLLEDVVKMQRGQLRDDSTILVAGFWERSGKDRDDRGDDR